MKFFLLLILCISCIDSKNLKGEKKLNSSKNNTKLLFVWQQFRHGARGPWISVDPVTGLDFIGERWKGEGELTPLGSRMHYLLGVSVKKRYKDFLSKKFNPNEIYVVSTDVNRTIMSAYSHLQGIYDNLTSDLLYDKQVNLSNIKNSNYSKAIDNKRKELNLNRVDNNINLFPVYLYPNNYGKEFLLYEPDICPNIVKYLERARQSETMQRLYREYSEKTNKTYGEYIFKFMNISYEKDPYYLWNTTNLYYIGDTFIADYIDGRNMSKIRETGINMDEFFTHSLNLSSLETYFGYFGNPLEITAYLQMSPVFRSIFNYMDMRINLDKSGTPDLIINKSPRFVMVSGHDTTLAANDLFLKEEFGVDYEHAVYCSSQIYELWKNESNGKYFIRYLVNQKLKAEFEYDSFKEKVFKLIYTEKEIIDICDGKEEVIIKAEEKKGNIFKDIFYICLSGTGLFSIILGVILLKGKN